MECEQCHKNRKETFTERMLSDDICSNKHNQNAQSKEANKKVNKAVDKLRVLTILREQGQATSKQIAEIMNKQLHQISGRISELKSDAIIEETGSRKDGCALLKVASKQLHFF
jgi:predicted HTH transcriptional regulator